MTGKVNNEAVGLTPYLSTRSAWAIAVGSSVGWGSLVVTGNTYLAQAGPLGSIIGILLGGLLMLLICRNYFFLADRYPSAGGIYTYTKYVFGYDRAFLVSWFLSLIYLSMFWANATSIPLFARIFIGDTFRFGYMYTVFGYEVYLGETIITLAAIALVAFICIKSKTVTAHIMFVLVAIFIIGIVVCLTAALAGHGSSAATYDPVFIPDRSAFSQVIRILFISPWAFIGFENITHSSEEFEFGGKKLYRVLLAAVITTTLLYIFVTLLSVTAYPSEYASWFEYIKDLDNLSGIKSLPAFYAAEYYLSTSGIVILSVSLFALVVTSLIGNLRALSRLFYSLSLDEILPKKISALNKKNIPAKAIILVSLVSAALPFLGRTTIGWIVDITTLGSTLIYGFVSAAAFKIARQEKRTHETVTGALGFIAMLIFGVYLIMPNILTASNLESETYFLLILWSVLGFVYFRRIIAKDHARRFGKAIIVWIALLSLVVLMGIIWTSRIEEGATKVAVEQIREYYNNAADPSIQALSENEFISKILSDIHFTDVMNTFAVIGLFTLSLAIMLINYFSMKKWEAKAVRERDVAMDAAYRDPLTGVKSKNAFADKEAEIDEKIRNGTAAEFAVIVCDVNGLKRINDTYGHKAGDRYIKESAVLICDSFKHSTVFRIGGDEFVIIPEGPDHENREALIGSVNAAVENNIGTDSVVISLGTAEFDKNTDASFHAVFERADGKMYERKIQLKKKGASVRD